MNDIGGIIKICGTEIQLSEIESEDHFRKLCRIHSGDQPLDFLFDDCGLVDTPYESCDDIDEAWKRIEWVHDVTNAFAPSEAELRVILLAVGDDAFEYTNFVVESGYSDNDLGIEMITQQYPVTHDILDYVNGESYLEDLVSNSDWQYVVHNDMSYIVCPSY